MRSIVLSCMLACTACGPGVHNLSSEADAIALLSAQVEGGLPAGNLRATLMWAMETPYCVGSGTLRPTANGALGCLGPSFRQSRSETVAVDGTAFVLPLSRLPIDSELTGAPGARLGIATLVLYDDTDNSGDLAIPESCGPEPDPDRVLATSFRSLLRGQALVYRERRFDPSGTLYPVELCPDPPPGYSVISFGLGDRGIECQVDTVTRTFALAPGDPEALSSVRCPIVPPTFSEPPMERPQGKLTCPFDGLSLTSLATDEVVFAVQSDCACPSVSRFVLTGCADPNSTCDTPEWDVPAPAWWPCN